MAFSLRTLFRKEQPNSLKDAASDLTRPPELSPESRGVAVVVANGHPEEPARPSNATDSSTSLPSLPQIRPMNNASPFQPAAEEGFTIRELSILLPPQLLKLEGLPPDYLVPLPIQSLYASFQAGRPCLRLSQICQTAPYLFSRQLLPGEDQEVALPYQKVRRILETAGMPITVSRAAVPEATMPTRVESPFTIASSAALPPRNAHSPFMSVSPQEGLGPVDGPMRINQEVFPPSPFQVSVQSPFTAPTTLGASSSQSPAAHEHPVVPSQDFNALAPSPFHAVSTGPVTSEQDSPFIVSPRLSQAEAPPAYPAPSSSSPFHVASPPPPFPASSPTPQNAAQEAPPIRTASPPFLNRSEPHQPVPVVQSPVAATAQGQASEEESSQSQVTLRLRSVLSSVPVAALGFDPVNVPDAVSVQFPLRLIAPQLATGKVSVKLVDLVNGVAEKFRPAFSRAQTDLLIELPLTDLLHALPTGLVPQPFAPNPEDAPKFATPFQVPASEDANRIPAPAAPVVLPPLLRPTPKHREDEPSFTVTPLSQLAMHEDLGPPRDPESLTAAPPDNLPLRGIPAPPSNEIDLPKITPPVGILPALPHSSAPPQQLSRPQEVPAPEANPAPSGSQDLQFGYQERQELRALRLLLDCPPGLTPEQLIEKVATLPGLQAALLINAQGQQNGGNLSSTPAKFFDSAVQSWHSLKMLAESMGLPAEGCFTLRADQMIRTFFLDGTICLAVLHAQPEFSNGIKDKLILVTREVARLCA